MPLAWWRQKALIGKLAGDLAKAEALGKALR
jgi:hypothetical protein